MFNPKNTTVYAGPARLRFKKHPDFMPLSQRLNKVHLRLGFTNLISTVRTDVFDLEKLALIAANTNTKVKRITISPNGEIKIVGEPSALPCYMTGDLFYTTGIFNQNRMYVGDPETGWYLYKNGLTADEFHKNIAFSEEKQAWICFSHRGSAIFKMYDMLFDAEWLPEFPLDYVEYWAPAMKYLHPVHQEELLDDQEQLQMFAAEYIPFAKRGAIMITNLEMARTAALNFYYHIR